MFGGQSLAFLLLHMARSFPEGRLKRSPLWVTEGVPQTVIIAMYSSREKTGLFAFYVLLGDRRTQSWRRLESLKPDVKTELRCEIFIRDKHVKQKEKEKKIGKKIKVNFYDSLTKSLSTQWRFWSPSFPLMSPIMAQPFYFFLVKSPNNGLQQSYIF